MAINNISNSNPSSQKVVLLLATIFLLLAIKETSAQSVSFDFPRFLANDRRITRQGTTTISNGCLTLPGALNASWRTGRVLYSSPVQIWDNRTGVVASFVTNFQFAATNYRNRVPADGFTFFLAPYGSRIPDNSGGGNLGIFDENSSTNQFVAVEFDSYSNSWDPNFYHIGINVNSRSSLRTMRWNRVSGRWLRVRISYDPPSRTLTVTVTDSQTGQVSNLSQVIDLRARLPAACSVGFSGTHSGYRERRDITAWSFTSTFNTPRAMENISTIASSAAAAA